MDPEQLQDETEFVCHACRKCYKVLLDKQTGKAGFIDTDEKKIPEPLFLPKGSLRSMMTIAMAVSCWMLIFKGKDVPYYLFSLVLTIIGYYFGFRKKIRSAESRIFDASSKKEAPLFLPSGFIRSFLIVGFVACAIFLYNKGDLKQLKYLEFFVILFGLISGYIFARLFSGLKKTNIYLFFNHMKGASVLVAAGWLVYLFLNGSYADNVYLALMLSSFISFYFGSRS